MTKPFAFAELVARVRALGRRAGAARPPVMEAGDLVLDPARHTVTRAGEPIELSPKEFAVLEALLDAGGATVSGEELLRRAWDENADPFTNTVRMTVMKLRRKLGDPPLIETVAGAGLPDMRATMRGSPHGRLRRRVRRLDGPRAAAELGAARPPLRAHAARAARQRDRLRRGRPVRAGVRGRADPGRWAPAGRWPASVLAPLGRITRAARRVSDERLDERIALEGPRDELRELADTFDAMLDDLGESFDAQRRFVANASHELRRPLTVIRSEAEVALAEPGRQPRGAARDGRGRDRGQHAAPSRCWRG